MRRFSELIDKLLLTSSRNRKVDILCDYFKNTPDPDRGFTLAIITNSLEIKNIPISSGLYLIHVDVPDVGERVLKWFGVIRPPDLDQF